MSGVTNPPAERVVLAPLERKSRIRSKGYHNPRMESLSIERIDVRIDMSWSENRQVGNAIMSVGRAERNKECRKLEEGGLYVILVRIESD